MANSEERPLIFESHLLLSRRRLLQAAPAALAPALLCADHADPPQPYGALPSERQRRWAELGYYNFLHFTVNTFTDREWGNGDEDPAIFNPTAFDADAIVETLKGSGSKGVILTAKHHDGFCLWPTKTTDHSIRHSPFRGGRGDIVKDLSEAARRHGLRFGVYLSPWDRNQATYGRPEYIALYREQMRELLTNYGPIFEIWHDGANGGVGFYGGAREKRLIDKSRYYDWQGTWNLERRLQPDAVLFSDVGPDIRWVGNEKGIAGDTCWATYTPVSLDSGPPAPGNIREDEAPTGTRNGKCWMPAECDVSIRPGWFWHAKENTQVKSPAALRDLYYQSVGRGAGFLLNVPPDRRGQIHESDGASLRAFGRFQKQTFERSLAAGARAEASGVRGGLRSFAAENLLDGNLETYWSTDDGQNTPQVTLTMPRPARFNLVRLREAIQLGQRISSFVIDVWKNGAWTRFGEGTSIGSCRLVRTAQSVETVRIRLRITGSPVPPALTELALFQEASF